MNLSEDEFKDLSPEIQKVFRDNNRLVIEKNQAYAERNKLVAALSKCFPSHTMRHDSNDKNWEDDWRWIVCIELPTGQATWHIHDSEINMFMHLQTKDNNYDGHTTEQKYDRLANLAKYWCERTSEDFIKP